MSMRQAHSKIEHLFRESHGRLIATLVNRYGVGHLEEIENAVMESYYKALKTWPFNGLPENAIGWLYTTSKRYLLDLFKSKHHQVLSFNTEIKEIDEMHDTHHEDLDQINDPELLLLFCICHPTLKKEDQLAFMLKSVSGFGIREIASALLQKEETIKKRLARARLKIQKGNIKFSEPPPSELASRIDTVHIVLYLLFNEGFYSSHPEKWVQKDLCVEAMRLCKFLIDNPKSNADTLALMSLMCYLSAQFDSRIDGSNNLILLKDQNRDTWNSVLIKQGHHYLEQSVLRSKEKSALQIEAAILSQHCRAENLHNTNWEHLRNLYNHLYKLKPHDLIKFNLVIVEIQLRNLGEAKLIFENISKEGFKKNMTTYYLVGAELYSHLENHFQFKLLLEKTLHNTDSLLKKNYLQKQFNLFHIKN